MDGDETRDDGPGRGQGGRERKGGGPADDRASGRRSLGDGLRQVNAVLSAFKEAVEESFQDARERGDLSADRARELVHGALAKARDAAGEARERLDFVPQRDFDELAQRVEELRQRVDVLEGRSSGGGPARAEDGPDGAPGGEGAGG